MKRKVVSMLLACTMAVSMAAGFSPIRSEAAEEAKATYTCQLHAKVTDAGEVVNEVVIALGEDKRAANIDEDTFTIHATATVKGFLEGTGLESNGDYDIDRKVLQVETAGQWVSLRLDASQGATLAYTTGLRNYPATLTYTITQNKPFTLMSPDGRILDEEHMAVFTCNNTVVDPETAKFESVKVPGGINYQFYNAGEGVDKLVVWFHGNGEGDLLSSGNNVAQMLANRGTVAWASDEFQEIFGKAPVMSFQAPDTWYYAQRDGLLQKAADEINDVIRKYGVDPQKVAVSGCSAGGYMTTRMLIAYPDMFAVAMINCPALDVATARGGETPTDEELASIKESDTAIWLVQGATDSSVATDDCSVRMFNILTSGQQTSQSKIKQELPQNSDMTTYETADNKYKLSLYDTTEDGKLRFAEDYDWDGVMTEVQYSNHWSWIYTLKNDPRAADGTHIVNWAAGYIK